MYEGDEIPADEEAVSNIRAQMNPDPVLPPTEALPILTPVPYSAPAVDRILGLSTRQIELINNVDIGQLETGAARERRLETLYRDISAIKKFLPYMDEIRGFLSTMPHDDNEDMLEALSLTDMKLRQFISEINAKLTSLETELDLKKVSG